MNCPSCAIENRDGIRFCVSCGAALAWTCAGCGAIADPEDQFCGACGRPRQAEPTADVAPERDPRSYTPKHLAEKILGTRSALEGERKQVTVLFADVKGSMELAAQVDPEEWHAILDHFFQILADGVHRFEGTVNQYTGDGIMALFGAPIAHEDHAQRACYAALWLRDELRPYADELRRTRGLNFSVRMGLNSGEVIVGKIGDDLRMDYTAQGHTVGLAQRIEQLASAESCYLTEATARLVRSFFDLHALGGFEIKGNVEPVPVFELAGVGGSRTRLEDSEARGFSRFVGREAEMERLDEVLAEALEGRGRVLGVVGAAGLGKSRLCVEFLMHCLEGDLDVHRTYCPSHASALPFVGVRELLRGIFSISEADSEEDARKKIAGTLVLLGDASPESLPYAFDFLGVGDPANPPPALDPAERRRSLFAFLTHVVRAKSERSGMVLFWDDVHWIDPGSNDALAHLVDAVQDTRTLLLLNYRPEYAPRWMGESHVARLELDPLGREALTALLDDLLGNDASLGDLREQIMERTQGNPFFTEEVVQTLVESDALVGARGAYRPGGPVETLEIPATVQPIIAARIDRLGDTEKRVLQIAAVIGKQFPEPLLNRISALPESDFAAALIALQDGEFLRVEKLFPEVEYAFKHPLTQEVAYDTQLQSTRSRTHAAVARALTKLDREKLGERASLIAFHFERANKPVDAAHWHLRSVEWLSGHDLDSTVRAFERAREQATRGADRRASSLQLAACIGLIGPLTAQDRPEPELRGIFEEGCTLAQELDDRAALLALYVLQGIHAQRSGDLEEHERLLAEARRIAPEDDATSRFVLALQSGLSRSKRGEVRAALKDFDSVADLDLPTIEGGGGSAAVGALTLRAAYAEYFVIRGGTLIQLGRYDEAERALDRGAELGKQHRLAAAEIDALSTRANLAKARGDVQAALQIGSELVERTGRLGSPLWAGVAQARMGSAHLLAGDPRAAVEALERGLAICRDEGVLMDAEVATLYDLVRARLSLGDVAAAREAVQEALGWAERTHDLGHRIRARLAEAMVALRDEAGRGEAEAALAEVEALIGQTGSYLWAPTALEIRSELASATGKAAARDAALKEAQRLYAERGATGHAERIARQLAAGAE